MRIEGCWVRERGEHKPWLGVVVAAMPTPTGQWYLLARTDDGELISLPASGVVIADDKPKGPAAVKDPK